MIRLKEWVPTKVDLLLTEWSTPIDGEATFVIFDKKDQIIWSKEFLVEWGKWSISLPKIKDNDYRFSVETDEWYSDLKDIKVSKSARGWWQEVIRSIHIDLNNEWVEENKEEVNEFFTKNGSRLKKIESDTEEHSKRMDTDKWEVMEYIGKHKNELEQKIELSSKEVKKEIVWVRKDLTTFQDKSVNKFSELKNVIDTQIAGVNDRLSQTWQSIQTITEAIWDISKKSDENGLSLSEKITRVEKKIPTGWILDYEVDDEGLSAKILWTSEKIDKRIRGEVGRQKKYVSYQNMFDTIEVSGQDTLQPSSPLDSLTLVAGSNMTITTDAETNEITFASTWWVWSTTWWAITGTLSDQTDLQTALDAKLDGNGTATYVPFYSDTNTLTSDAHFNYDSVNDVLHVHKLAGDATDGLLIESDNGTDVWVLWAANTANVTWYGNHNYNAATADTIAIFWASKTLSSASTATYPSLVELAFLKWVTSAIQTQLNAKQPLDTQLTDLAGLSYTGNSLKVIRVNAGETWRELATAAWWGDVTKVWTPVNNQVAIWTGDGTIEWDTNLQFSAGVLKSWTYAGIDWSWEVFISNDITDDTAYIHLSSNSWRSVSSVGTYKFQGSGSIDGILSFSWLSTSAKTFTFPNATGTVSLIANTETLSNKTLTAPKFVSWGFIADANWNEILVFVTTASAINHWSMTNASWTSVIFEAAGDSANVNAVIRGKGNGRVTIGTSTSTALVLAANQPIEDNANRELLKFTQATTAVNEVTIGNAATGNWPSISATWDDTNINLNISAKWTWVVASSSDITVPDEAYDATLWNWSLEVPTKNAIRDKIESMSAWSGITRTVVVTSWSATMWSAASTDYVYFVAWAHTMSLPAASGNTNRYVVKNNHTANITIDTVGAELIEWAASISIAPEDSVDIMSNGTNRFII